MLAFRLRRNAGTEAGATLIFLIVTAGLPCHAPFAWLPSNLAGFSLLRRTIRFEFV